MPRVGDKEFPYTEEGMAAAEAEAAAMEQPAMDEEAALEELLAQIPMEGEEPPAEEAGEEMPDESPIVMPEAGTMAELFEVVFGDSFDAEDPSDAERMSQVESMLASVLLCISRVPELTVDGTLAFFLLTVSLGNFLTSQVKFLLLQDDGSSKMSAVQEFWFWTGLILITAFLFMFVTKSYKTVEFLHDA